MAVEIRLPDLGDFQDVEIIEIHAAAGEHIEKEAALLTIESDKASMDVPSPESGTIASLKVAVGDRINQGDLLALLEDAPESEAQPTTTKAPAKSAAAAANKDKPAAQNEEVTVKVPDIGDFDQVEVIEVAASAGATVQLDETLITLESDKASMDVPSPVAGTVVKMLVAAGTKVAAGDAIAVITSNSAPATEQPAAAKPAPDAAPKDTPAAQDEEVTVKVPDIGDFDQVEV
ncbi:MAG: dihydrolipoamide acetyltransferase, partial [Betaproteobacteria bacterium]|nr:dihydrolipoamide acetyltransferase [Betaproteobacteria bacterium]